MKIKLSVNCKDLMEVNDTLLLEIYDKYGHVVSCGHVASYDNETISVHFALSSALIAEALERPEYSWVVFKPSQPLEEPVPEELSLDAAV